VLATPTVFPYFAFSSPTRHTASMSNDIYTCAMDDGRIASLMRNCHALDCAVERPRSINDGDRPYWVGTSFLDAIRAAHTHCNCL